MIVFKYGELQNIGAVRRYFAAKLFPKLPRKVPACKAFKMVIRRFHLTGNVKKQPKVGRQQGPEENIDRVKVFPEKNEDASVRKVAQELALGYGTVLRILKKKLCSNHTEFTELQPFLPHILKRSYQPATSSYNSKRSGLRE